MQDNKEAIKLMEMLSQNLVEGNFQYLRNLAEQQGIHPVIRDSILTITKLFEQITLQSNIHEVDIFFYRDFIREIMNGQLNQAAINNRLDITREKKEEAIHFLRKFKSSEQSRISAESELKSKNRQLEEIKTQSMIRSDSIEKEYIEKQITMSKQVSQYEQEVQMLRSNLQCQAEIIKETMNRQEERQQELKKKNQLISDLIQRQRKKERELIAVKCQLDDIKTELEISKLMINQSTDKSKILSIQNSKIQEKIQEYKHKESDYKNVISKHEEENFKLKEELDLLQTQLQQTKVSRSIKRRSTKQLFIDSNSLIQHFQMNETVADSFHQTLAKQVGEVLSMRSLYNYSLHKGENFHKRVDNKRNILLLCLTDENRIIGGFSSYGFSLKTEQESKAFLFGIYEEKMKVFDLKKGKNSTVYDNDFIMFGNEELCIEKGTDLLTSYFVNGPNNILHYKYEKSQDRENFLSSKHKGVSSVHLLNYEIIELKMKSD